MQNISKSITLAVASLFLLVLFSSAPFAKNTEQKININEATIIQLQQISGIGKKIAGRIIAFRKTNGPFKTLDEIKKVKGIGEKTFETIKSHIEIGVKHSLLMRQ